MQINKELMYELLFYRNFNFIIFSSCFLRFTNWVLNEKQQMDDPFARHNSTWNIKLGSNHSCRITSNCNDAETRITRFR